MSLHILDLLEKSYRIKIIMLYINRPSQLDSRVQAPCTCILYRRLMKPKEVIKRLVFIQGVNTTEGRSTITYIGKYQYIDLRFTYSE